MYDAVLFGDERTNEQGDSRSRIWFLTSTEGFMEVELMVTKRDNQPTDRVNIEQSASGRLEGRVLQLGQNFKQLKKKKISSSQSFNTLYTVQMNFGGKYISVY